MNRIFKMIFLLNILFCTTQLSSQNIEIKNIGKGPAIILLPGVGTNPDVWNPVIDILKSDYECHNVSIKGFAGIPVDTKVDFSKIQIELTDYIKRNKIENPIIIGHSLGGILTLSTVCNNPDLFSKVIILDTYACPLAGMDPVISKEEIINQSLSMKNTILNLTDQQFRQFQEQTITMSVTGQSNYNKLFEWTMISDRATIANAYYEMLSSDYRAKMDIIKVPILVIGTWEGVKNYGLTKEKVRNTYTEQYKSAENCSILIADNSKHFIMLDNPEWLNKQLLKFIN